MDRDEHVAIMAPQLTGKACLAYAAMTDTDVRDYDRTYIEGGHFPLTFPWRTRHQWSWL